MRIGAAHPRQDYSSGQKVTDWTADSWPPTQRFDFLVRKRVLTPAGAAARALRELTGRDFGAGAVTRRGPPRSTPGKDFRKGRDGPGREAYRAAPG